MSIRTTRIQRASTPWRELPYLRIQEVAEVLGVSRKTVDGLVEGGELSVRRIGRIPLVEVPSLIEWVDGDPARPPTVVRITPEARAAARRLVVG